MKNMTTDFIDKDDKRHPSTLPHKFFSGFRQEILKSFQMKIEQHLSKDSFNGLCYYMEKPSNTQIQVKFFHRAIPGYVFLQTYIPANLDEMVDEFDNYIELFVGYYRMQSTPNAIEAYKKLLF